MIVGTVATKFHDFNDKKLASREEHAVSCESNGT
jgi:hypothetical protein